MAFEKRVCVLKQIKKGFTADGGALSGAVYVERLGTEITVVPRLLGVAPVREGRYALALWIDEQVFVTDLGDGGAVKLEGPSIKAGFAALLVYVRGEAQAVAFGSCGVAPCDYLPLLAAFERKEKPLPTPLPPTELPTFSPNNVPLAPTVPLPGEPEHPFREGEEAAANYDDEAIAAENYYAASADDDGKTPHSSGKETDADGGDAPPHEDAVHPLLVGGGLTYYNSVREKLRAAFRNYPKDERLRSVYPASEWVKTDGALLGVIYRGGLPEFLCVAVEANGDPPESMKEHCCFVPASPLSDTVGFYVVYQSATTGEYVTVSDS